MKTSSNPYEFKWNPKGVIFLLIALISAYIFLNEPPFIFDNLPIEIPANYFGIIAMVSLIISLRFSKGTINEYVCPSCKGVLFDIDRFKHVKKGKITKKSAKKRNTILQLLNDSSELSELQCPSCSKEMNSVKVLYKIKHDSQAGNFILEETIEDIVDSVMAGEKEMQIEGCKSCKSLWLDESNRLDISRGTIVSNEESLE
jgi:Zn-finger nucleic acid-binding protein